MVQCGGIISANIYRTADAPRYKHGNKILIAVNVLSIALFIYAKVYYVIKNKARDKKWNALTIEVRYSESNGCWLMHRSNNRTTFETPSSGEADAWTLGLHTKLVVVRSIEILAYLIILISRWAVELAAC
jgi:hypothetical protein